MFLQNLRAKIGARLNGNKEAGFTLVELLVVMLILGILAAIAIPAFFNQRDKAGDAEAKEVAHAAQVAMETCATERNGQYTDCELPQLEAIEPTLPPAAASPPNGELGLDVVSSEPTDYTIRVTSTTRNTFDVVNDNGTLTYPCAVNAGNGSNRGGCPDAPGVGPDEWD
jgi:type IV pilus assembly protein PilA